MTKTSTPFFIWFVLTGVLGTVTYWLYEFGVINSILDVDATKLTTVIGALFILSHFWIGIMTFKGMTKDYYYGSGRYDKSYRVNSFISNQLPQLGLLGTVIGFILFVFALLNNAGATLDSVDAINQMILDISSAMGTALYTTVAGLIGAMLIRLQLFVLSHILGFED